MLKYFLSIPILLFCLWTSQAKAQKSLGSDSIDVTHYQININITDFTSKIISGNTSLKALPKTNSLQIIPLDLLEMTIDSIKLGNSITSSYTYNDTLIKISTGGIYNLGDTMRVTVYYHGVPQMDASTFGGFYFSGDYAYNLGVAFDADPHNYGRVWFPCVDDFVDKAFYSFNITTQATKMAVCNGEHIATIDNGNGTKTWSWFLSQPMSTYLASVAVAPYTKVSDTVNASLGALPIAIYAKPADSLKAVNSFANLKQILLGYEDRFGPYRWDRVGYVAVPFNYGAMEHATNIAYPVVCITGTNAYDFLYAHELSHHWFGDLVTCSKAEDMWINEGWAVFSEFIYKEIISGDLAARNYMKEKLFSVLKTAHIEDNGFFALCGVPHDITYGKTVYDKGGLVVHTLRHYMGDSLFFSTVKKYTEAYKFSDIDCAGLRDFFSAQSGMNLNNFFDNWVFEPGFPHYDYDSVKVSGTEPNISVNIYMKQKYYGRNSLFNGNKVEIEFLKSDFSSERRVVSFDGSNAMVSVNLNFVPVQLFVDPDQQVADAVTSDKSFYKSTAIKALTEEYCTITPTAIADSMLLLVEHHWVTPDPVKNNTSIYRLSPNRYWRISGVVPTGNVFKAKFDYNRINSASAGYLDVDFLPLNTSTDSLILVYRANPADDWRIIPFTKTGNSLSGKIETANAMIGEYALAIGEPGQSGIYQSFIGLKVLDVFPNPSKNSFSIINQSQVDGWARIVDINGRPLESFELKSGVQKIWNAEQVASGIYFMEFYSEQKLISTQKLVLQR